MRFSVLIATYKRAEILDKTLCSFTSLKLNSMPWEILLADNADDEATRQVYEKYADKLPIRYFVETKPGKNNALNSILPHAKGDLFVFCDDDIIADPNWLIEIYEGSKRWPDADIFGGKTLPKWPDDQPPPYDLRNNYLSSMFGLTTFNKETECQCKADKAYGTNLAIRSKIFSKGYSFNPSFGPCGTNYVMGSESELLRRLEAGGHQTIYLPHAIVYHQIRKEQLCTKWLLARSYRLGRGSAYWEGESTMQIMGVPRYLIKDLFILSMKRLTFIIMGRKENFYRDMRYHFIRGAVSEFAKKSKFCTLQDKLNRQI